MTANENDRLREELQRYADGSHHEKIGDQWGTFIPNVGSGNFWHTMTTAIAALAAPEGWQPIETAPKDDSTQVIAWIPAQKFIGSMTVFFAVVAGATLWQPLPAAPAAGVPTR